MSNRLREYAGDDQEFLQWLTNVDRVISARVGLSLMDLADQDYGGMFRDGLDPKDVASDVLAEEGLNDDEDYE